MNFRLKNKLGNMLSEDQALRKSQWKEIRRLQEGVIDDVDFKKISGQMSAAMRKMDQHHTKELKKIIARYGWPGKKLVGKSGAKAAWLLAQHADHDIRFQVKCLGLIKNALTTGDTDKTQLAYLTDRVLVHQNKKQLYGTQFRTIKDGKTEPLPIQNPKKLNARRKSKGLEPFTKYKIKMRALYK